MNPWHFLVVGYIFTVCIETPFLLVGLSARHSLRRRLFAGLWLTMCTYPIVVLVLPTIFDPDTDRFNYLLVAEVFAPVAECLLFLIAFDSEDGTDRWDVVRDFAAIVVANLASFLLGELLGRLGFFSAFV